MDKSLSVNKPANFLLSSALQIALMAVISLLSIIVYDRLRYQPIITVDIEAIMNSKMKQVRLDNDRLEKEQIVQLSQQWARNLDQAVNDLTNNNNAVVFSRPAVIHGSIDMTAQLLKSINPGSQQK